MKTVILLFFACLFILVITGTSFGDVMTQTSYRWRNDDGDVYSAKWKDSANTPVALTDNNNIRLRIEFKTDDTLSANISLGYMEDHYNNPRIMINRSDTGNFILSESKYLSDCGAYSDNHLLPFSNNYYNYQQTITFDSSESYYMNLLSGNLLYEFEYSIKPMTNLKPGSVYFFLLLKNGKPVSCDEEAVLMTPPVSWSSQPFGKKYITPFYVISDISFVDENTGTAVGWDNEGYALILRTTDGGKTWTEQICPVGGPSMLSVVCFTSADIGTAAGYGGTILRTTNGGRDWTSMLSGVNYNFSAISFAGADTGIVIGHDGGTGTLILRTVNGGKDWSQYLYGNAYLSSVKLVDSKTGYIVGEAGTVLKTTDGGQSWINQARGTTKHLVDASFPDVNNGYVVGEGTILKTTDGGNNWTLSFDNKLIYLSSLYFINKNTGWAVGDAGMIIKTTDSGSNWNILPICTRHYLTRVQFIDEKTGWVLDYNNKIIKTTDGGIATSIIESKDKDIPENYYLSQNYPNPFNPQTKIMYSVPQNAFVTILVFDILGKEVVRLVNEEKSAGNYEVIWNTADLSSGVYFCRFKSGNFIETKKMILLR